MAHLSADVIGRVVETGSAEDANPRFRQSQEDTHQVITGLHEQGDCFAAVYDGHGGGEISQELPGAVPGVLKTLLSTDDEVNYPDLFREFCGQVDKEVMEKNQTAGSTAVGVYFTPSGQIATFNLGDAEALIVKETDEEYDLCEHCPRRAVKKIDDGHRCGMHGSDGEKCACDGACGEDAVANVDGQWLCAYHDMIRTKEPLPVRTEGIEVLTKQHKLGHGRYDDLGPYVINDTDRVIMAGGNVDRGRINGVINVSRAFGDFTFKSPEKLISCEPSVSVFKYTEDMTAIVLGCDGVFDVLTYENVADIVRAGVKAGSSAQESAQAIVTAALQQHTTDNVTATVLYLGH